MSYDPNNIFAKIMRDEIPSVRVYEDSATLVIMDIMPRANGHMLVIPKEPVRNMLDATPEQLAACIATVQKMGHAAIKAFDAQGVTVQQFNEAAGGQEVFHLHYHVIPRKTDESMRRPGPPMEAQEVLTANAERIKSAL